MNRSINRMKEETDLPAGPVDEILELLGKVPWWVQDHNLKVVAEHIAAYPLLPMKVIIEEVKRAVHWALGEPKKSRKKLPKRFWTNWLNKRQEKWVKSNHRVVYDGDYADVGF